MVVVMPGHAKVGGFHGKRRAGACEPLQLVILWP